MVGTQEQREDPEGGGTGLLGTEGQRDMVVPGMGFPTKKKSLWFHHVAPSHAVKGACASTRETRCNGERIQLEEGQVGDAQ